LLSSEGQPSQENMTSEEGRATLLAQAHAQPCNTMQTANVVGQTSMVKVAVPSGAVAGQQINFTMPNGVRVCASVQENVQPGEMMTVAVPSQPVPQAPQVQQAPNARVAVPPTGYISLEEVDRAATQRDWMFYLLSIPLCCCVNPTCALLVWAGLALNYFCKPREERERRPQQFGPACAAASTAGACCCFMFLMGIFFVVGVIAYCGVTTDPEKMEVCSMKIQNMTEHPYALHHGHLRAEPLRFVAGDSDEASLNLLTEDGDHSALEAAAEPMKPMPGRLGRMHGKLQKLLEFFKLPKETTTKTE